MATLAQLAQQQMQGGNPWLSDMTPAEQADIATQQAAFDAGSAPGGAPMSVAAPAPAAPAAAAAAAAPAAAAPAAAPAAAAPAPIPAIMPSSVAAPQITTHYAPGPAETLQIPNARTLYTNRALDNRIANGEVPTKLLPSTEDKLDQSPSDSDKRISKMSKEQKDAIVANVLANAAPQQAVEPGNVNIPSWEKITNPDVPIRGPGGSIAGYAPAKDVVPPLNPLTSGRSSSAIAAKLGAKPFSLENYAAGTAANDQAHRDAAEQMGQSQQAINDARVAGFQTAADIGKMGSTQDQLAAINQTANTRAAIESMNQRSAEIEKERQSLLGEKIDPKHYYKEVGTAGTIAGAIAIGLGAFGAAMPHTTNHQNYAFDIINKAVENDIAGQKENLNNKWNALTAKSNLSKDQFARSQWNIEQMSRERERAWLNVKNQVQSQLTQTDSDVAKQNGGIILGQTEDKLASIKQDALDHRMTVQKQISARDAAAAAAQQSVRDFITNRTVENMKEYNMSESEAAKRAYEEGNIKYKGQLPAGDTEVPQSRTQQIATEKTGKADKATQDQKAALEDSITSIGKQYDQQTKTNPGVLRTGFARTIENRVSPDSEANMQDQSREQFNQNILALSHQVMTTRSPEIISKIAEQYQATPWDNAATLQQKKANFIQYLRDNAALTLGKKVDEEK